MAKQKGPVQSFAIRLRLVVATLTDLRGCQGCGDLWEEDPGDPTVVGKLWHQLGAANACGGPSCCWCPAPTGPPGVGLPLSQRGLEVQMPAALAMRAGGVLKLDRAYSLSSSTARVRASWRPSLQSLMALYCLPYCPSEDPTGTRTAPRL